MAGLELKDITHFSGGNFLGKAYPIARMGFDIPRYILKKSQIPQELKRFIHANNQAIRDIEALHNHHTQLHNNEQDFSDLLDFQIRALSDSTMIRMIKTRIKDAGLNAEAATEDSVSEILRRYSNVTDDYMLDRAADIRALGNRLLTLLQCGNESIPDHLPANAVIIADEIGPAEMIKLIRKKTKAIIVSKCGGFSHTAILARASAIPLLVYRGEQLQTIKKNDIIGYNADDNILFLSPSSKQQKILKMAVAKEEYHQQHDVISKPPYYTASRKAVHIRANIELPEEIEIAEQQGAEGIGLLRTEFLFFGTEHAMPTEEEQYNNFKNIASKFQEYPITVRTLDVGGDKIPPILRSYFTEDSHNALSPRGIGFCLQHPDIFIPHLRALLRASQHGNMRILIPMITNLDDLQKTQNLIDSTIEDLKNKKKLPTHFKKPPIGIMIEVPSAAICADILAAECDFFAIGSNDLTQFTLIRDRGRYSAHEYFQKPELAVIRLIEMSVKAAQSAKIPICICGEAPNPNIIEALLTAGLRDFSISPRNIQKFVHYIKDL